MRIEIEPRLIDEAVFWKLRSINPDDAEKMNIVKTHHRTADRLYKINRLDERESGFNDLNRESFHALGLMHPIEEVLNYFPIINNHVELFVLGYAFRKSEEEADLFQDSGGILRVILKAKAQTLVNSDIFLPLAYHELFHISDMLSPDFEFHREIEFSGEHPAHKDMLRERYRLLWDIHIDSRLHNAGKPFCGTKERYAKMFASQFGTSQVLNDSFERLWSDKIQPSKHSDWVQAAQSSSKLFQLTSLQAPLIENPGARKFSPACPICKCPTSVWVEHPEILPEKLESRIKSIIPYWTSQQGLCKQCEEMLGIEPITMR